MHFLHVFFIHKQTVKNAAENYRVLKKCGITRRKTADVIIATFCIHKSIPQLFADKDFIPFTKHLKLQSVSTET